jgi:hypothetical protein
MQILEVMNKFKKKVLSKLPKAYIERDFDGSLYIMHDEEPIVAEYFYPETADEETAWRYAAEALKITQNFNRTHPDRMDLADFESKSNRITNRTTRGKRNRHA